MKTFLKSLLTFAVSTCVLAFMLPAAHADTTWNFTATGTGYNITGTITGSAEAGNPNVFDLTAANLSINGVANTLVAAPAGTNSTNSAITSDINGDEYAYNQAYYLAPPVFDFSGLLVSDALGNFTNIFNNPALGNPGYQLLDKTNYTQSNVGVALTIDTSLVTSPVPEPSSLALLGTGLLGAVGLVRRRLSV